MSVVLLSSDLSVSSRVEGAAVRLNKKVRIARDASQLDKPDDDDQPELLIVDLSAPSLDIEAVVRQWKASRRDEACVIAFGPHVHENRLAAARDAGCDIVVSRGQFFSQLESLLQSGDS
jgi:DNA-binding response OmpR family regulator